MKCKLSTQSILAAIIALSGTAALAEQNKQSESTTSQATKSVESQQKTVQKNAAEPEGYVLMTESVAVDLQQLPIAFMEEAQQQVRDKNFGEASSSLRAASRILSSGAKSAKQEQSKSEAKTAATTLNRIAEQVKKGELKNENQLKPLLGDIAYHMAKHHRLQAESEWTSNLYKLAGFDMRASFEALEKGAKWTGRETALKGTASVDQIRNTANQLIAGTGWNSRDVTQAFQQLDQSIQKVGAGLAEASTSATTQRQPASEDAADQHKSH